jgi:peptidoglycan lytic transglycosylase
VLLALSVGLAACSVTQPPPRPTGPPTSTAYPTVFGVASWYGPGFKGHRTSSGKVYTADAMTAASTMFPLGTRLRVTDLDNGRAIEVTVDDHGPFVKDRKLDLSELAARTLGMVGPGTARVRMEVLRTPAGGPAIGQRYFVQVGSFADEEHARRVSERLAAYYPDVHVETATTDSGRYYRVRMGAFLDRQAAIERASSVSGIGFPAMLITE